MLTPEAGQRPKHQTKYEHPAEHSDRGQPRGRCFLVWYLDPSCRQVERSKQEQVHRHTLRHLLPPDLQNLPVVVEDDSEVDLQLHVVLPLRPEPVGLAVVDGLHGPANHPADVVLVVVLEDWPLARRETFHLSERDCDQDEDSGLYH